MATETGGRFFSGLAARRRAWAAVAAIVPILLAPFTPVAGLAAANDEAAPAMALYAAPDKQPYQPLDPHTLADLAGAPPLDFGMAYPSWAISDDSATVVVREADGMIVVSDGLGGPERLRFAPPVSVVYPRLSGDGSRLVMSTRLSGSPSGITPATWYVFDTDEGRLISTIEEAAGADLVPGGLPASLINPRGERLYHSAASGEGDGPWPLQLVARDLTTGEEVGRLTLPEVRAGAVYSRSLDQAPIADVLTPAVALSPDGVRLAVVSAETDELTLVDARTMTVERTVAIARPQGLARRALTWLGVLPQAVSAKYMDGRHLQGIFSPDGRLLYTYGFAGEVGDAPDEATQRGLGLTAIEVATGAIVATALDGQVLSEVLPAPDGASVYANGPTVPWIRVVGQPSYRLSRLDAANLGVLAEREFPARRSVVVVPEPNMAA